MLTCYTPVILPRIEYSIHLIFEQFLGISVRLISDSKEFSRISGPKMHYSLEKLEGFTIVPSGFLSETGIRSMEPEMVWMENIPCLFPVNTVDSLPFDPFSAAFYMVSRYEEYTGLRKDEHGRIVATGTFAYRKGFLDIPVVEHWACLIQRELIRYYPEMKFPDRHFRHIPTIDIDIAYAYLHHGWIRHLGGSVKNAIKGNFKNETERIFTLLGVQKDPFDVFDLLNNWFTKYRQEPHFFFLLSDYGRFDKNLPFNHPAMKKLIQSLDRHYPIGIHPSYNSFREALIVNKEIKRLESVLHKNVDTSRQHFLRLELPGTYRILEACGIQKDYSMGFADLPGFRAGCCTPFRFYDLELEKESLLTVYPFQVMDGTLNQYMGLSVDEAIEKVRGLIRKVKDVKGTFISLWHNESLGEKGIWENWQNVYHQLLKETTEP